MDKVHLLESVNQQWTLFLDRDGVINQRIEADYVKSINEFEILPGVLEALYELSMVFGKIIVVTNQQGIGKGIMTAHSLSLIHQYLLKEVENAAGNINAIYYCPHLEGECSYCRKPGIGMAIQAKSDFPEIDFHKSIMVGDSDSDILFGQNAGMLTVFCSKTNGLGSKLADMSVADLKSFSNLLLGYIRRPKP
ncbi:MAG: HAD family hydrolase [Saprospiraceae bacterium]|nr:HAD family hydrolase [Saprospiraceae bacterium]